MLKTISQSRSVVVIGHDMEFVKEHRAQRLQSCIKEKWLAEGRMEIGASKR